MQAPALSKNWNELKSRLFASWPAFSSIPDEDLLVLMTPALSMAHWILRNLPPSFLERPKLSILMVGHCEYSIIHEGRWLQLSGWALGKPNLDIRFTRVGYDVTVMSAVAINILGVPAKDMGSLHADDDVAGYGLCQTMRRTTMIKGEWEALAQAYPQGLTQECFDACFLLHPDLLQDEADWLKEPQLKDLIRHKVPVGVFSMEMMEYASGVEMIQANSWDCVSENGSINYWHPCSSNAALSVGTPYAWVWSLQGAELPKEADEDWERVDDWVAIATEFIDSFGEVDFPAFSKLGKEFVHLAEESHAEVRYVRLFDSYHVDRADGKFYIFSEQAANMTTIHYVPEFRQVTQKWLAKYPGDDCIIARCKWAAGIFSEFAFPFITAELADLHSEMTEPVDADDF